MAAPNIAGKKLPLLVRPLSRGPVFPGQGVEDCLRTSLPTYRRSDTLRITQIRCQVQITRRLKPEEEEVLRKREELAAIRATLAERELELVDLRSQLAAFEGRYLRQVGTLYAELDEWKARISELQARLDPSAASKAQAEEAREQARQTYEDAHGEASEAQATSPHRLNLRGCTVKQPNASIQTLPQIPPIGSAALASWPRPTALTRRATPRPSSAFLTNTKTARRQ